MRASQLHFERLEFRALLAAAIATVDDAGLLSISGTEAGDHIRLTAPGDTLRVRQNAETQDFALASVQRVEIQSLGGDDFVDWSGMSLHVSLNSGEWDAS